MKATVNDDGSITVRFSSKRQAENVLRAALANIKARRDDLKEHGRHGNDRKVRRLTLQIEPIETCLIQLEIDSIEI